MDYANAVLAYIAAKMTLGDFFDLSKNVLVPAAAVYFAYRLGTMQVAIAHQQACTAELAARTARNKLNLDLFDKRWQVYEATRELIGAATTYSNVTQQDLSRFLVGTQGAIFLFDASVENYLSKDVYEKALDLQRIVIGLEMDKDNSALRTEKITVLNWFSEQLGELARRMRPYMAVDQR